MLSHQVSAWNCIGLVPPTHHVRRAGGRVLYEQALYNDATSRSGERVKLARLVVDERGMREAAQWVDADAPVELVREDGTVEPNPEALLREVLGC
jgi:hypothetical protein